jgi:predicted metal-dependent peptidase
MHRQIIKARSTMLFDHPFFGTLALNLKLKPDWKCKTFYTNGKVIGFNPKYAAERSFEEIIALIAEEVMHNADGHTWRRDGRDAKDWNRAADFSLMPILIDAGMKVPADNCYDQQYRGKSPEFIYGKVHREPEPPKSGVGSGGGAGTPQPQPDDEEQEDEDKPDDSQDEQEPEDEEDQADQPDQSEDAGEPEDPGSGGEVRDLADDVNEEEARSEWQVMVIQAAQIAKNVGKLPLGIERIVDQITHPAIQWQDVLRQRIQQIIDRNDYSWRRPNRRYISQGIYLPEIRSEKLPAGALLWDTSGSMDNQNDRAMIAAECANIIDECRPEKLYVLYWDTELHGCDEFEPNDKIEFHPVGGGGTDFSGVFDYMEKEGIDPAFFIGITDMYAMFPDKEPDYPVIWASTTDRPAPFGEVVRVGK